MRNSDIEELITPGKSVLKKAESTTQSILFLPPHHMFFLEIGTVFSHSNSEVNLRERSEPKFSPVKTKTIYFWQNS